VTDDLASLDVAPDGAALLAELHAALTRYVVLPSPESADAIVFWITATHAAPAWNCAPRLDVTSPVKRCGKSRLPRPAADREHQPGRSGPLDR
jgi:hypothetical protein